MPQTSRLISLKGGPLWGGLSDTSDLSPAEGLFQVLTNMVVSRDGSELRTAPGSKLSGKPFIGHPFDITGGTLGNPTVVNIQSAFNDGIAGSGRIGLDKHLMEATGSTFSVKVYVSGNSDIVDGVYDARRNDDDTLDIDVDTDAGTLTADGTVWVQRLGEVHMMASVNGRPVVVAEPGVWKTSGTVEINEIGSWVGGTRLSLSSPETPNVASATDVGFLYWPCPTTINITAESELWDHLPTGRIVGDIINGRLVLAVPGNGICYEVNVESSKFIASAPPVVTNTAVAYELADFRWMRALGIPKGTLLTGLHNVTSIVGVIPGEESVHFAVGYLDPYTGEAGLPSSIETYTVPLNSGVQKTHDLQVLAYKAKDLVRESSGLWPILYLTEFNDSVNTSLVPQKSFRGDQLTGLSTRGNYTAHGLEIDFVSDRDKIIQPRRFPRLDVMPPGATWVRALRARMFIGGQQPDVVELAVRLAKASNVSEDGSERFYVYVDDSLLGGDKVDALMANYLLSSAYGGYKARISPLGRTGATEAVVPITLVKKVNPPNPNIQQDVYEIAENLSDFTPAVFNDLANAYELHLDTQPSVVRFSEEDHPGVMPAVNALFVDKGKGFRSTGALDVGNTLLLFTDKETYATSWSAIPRQQGMLRISGQYGCIASASVVDGVFGGAWLSSYGPCVFDGATVRFIGDKIQGMWSTFKKDSEGLMNHAQGMVDEKRNLVIWTVRRDLGTTEWASASTDALKSKVAADTLLIWNYETGAFSIQEMEGYLQPLAAATMALDDGSWRPSFIINDSTGFVPIYSWDDDSAQIGSVVLQDLLSTPQVPGSAVATGTTNPGVVSYARGYIHNVSGKLKWFGRVTTVSGINYTLEDFEGAEWATGDLIQFNGAHGTMKTHRFKVSGDMSTHVSGVVLQLDLDAGNEGTQRTWAKVQVLDQDEVVVLFSVNKWGDKLKQGLNRFRAGGIRGTDFTVQVEIVGNGRVHIKDISVEVE